MRSVTRPHTRPAGTAKVIATAITSDFCVVASAGVRPVAAETCIVYSAMKPMTVLMASV